MSNSDPRTVRTMPGGAPTDEDLRHDIDLTREELAGTASALAHKADVRTRTAMAVRRHSAQLQRYQGPVIGAAAGAFVLLVLVKWLRRPHV